MCLGFVGNSIINEGIEKIVKVFSFLECKVKSLNLSCNVIGDEGVENFLLSLSSLNCSF